jgi:hypothetical protein
VAEARAGSSMGLMVLHQFIDERKSVARTIVVQPCHTMKVVGTDNKMR